MKGATAADNDFFEEAIKQTGKVTCNDVENTYVDGAYQSEKNREFAKDKINIIRRKVESIPLEERKKRNNVEAAMFLYGFHTRNNKTRYHTLLKHGLQAIARCAWINMHRLFWFDQLMNTNYSPE